MTVTWASVPGERGEIADGDLISHHVWAALQGVAMSTFWPQLTRSRAHRRHDAEHPDEKPQVVPGDIPEPDGHDGRTPLWFMSTYRVWERQRPGLASSRGKAGPPGSRGGTGAGRPVRLPLECPHCRHEITEADVAAAEGQLRERYAALRSGGALGPEAAAKLGLSGQHAKRVEMAWRASQRGPLTAGGEQREADA